MPLIQNKHQEFEKTLLFVINSKKTTRELKTEAVLSNEASYLELGQTEEFDRLLYMLYIVLATL